MSTASFILVKDGKILMEYRHKPVEYKDKWLMPGGKVEPGETPEEAAIREAKEEAGITIVSLEPIVTAEPIYTITRTPYPVVAFHATSWYGEVPPHNLEDGSPFDWWYIGDLIDYEIHSVREIAKVMNFRLMRSHKLA
jgi:8-oxo-dGTP diphosphatase